MSTQKDGLWVRLEDFVNGLLRETGVPGCSVGILQNGEVRTAGFGIANIDQGRPVTADTLFQIGSITKTFTATVAMKLVEEGKLDLHVPVQTYLADFMVADPDVSAKVTPYHLLTHTAGWDGDLFLDTGENQDALSRYVSKMENREQLFPLGELFSYNNAGFVVLGAILEIITNKQLEVLFREFIADPLGLEDLYFSSREVIGRDYAVGHQEVDGEIKVAHPWHLPRCVLPMGAIVTTTEDLLRYAKSFLIEWRNLLDPETISEMFSEKIIISKEDRTSVGYSWMRRDLNDGFLIGHGGGTNGQISQLTMLPEQEYAFAVFTNSEQGRRFTDSLNAYILEEFAGMRADKPTMIESTPEQLAVYEGTATRPGFKFHLRMMGDHLVGMEEIMIGFPTENDPPPPPVQPYRVGRCGEDRLIILDGEAKDVVCDVFRDEDGDINYIRLGRVYQFEPELKSG